MPSDFHKVSTETDFPALERSVLDFWKRTNAFARRRDKNRGKPPWSFLDGPITANNPMGVHHAWGRTYKDIYNRYFAMAGHELRYQNGFDCQGLWVEVEVEKELGLKSKQDIENLVPGDRFASIDHFVRLCKERVDKFARIQTEQSIRLGYWMDWDREEDWRKPPDQRRSYFTMSEENNYTIWSFLKKCHGRELIYRAYDSMPWCPRCAVGISQMEMHEGYQRVAHRAVFVRFPLRGRPGENLLVWTTTPWTLTSNVAAAVNPELTYLKVRHRNEIYYLAKGTFTFQRLDEEFRRKEWIEGVPKLKSIEQIFKEKGGYEVLGELPGSALIGWEYEGPFDELDAQNSPGGYPPHIAEAAVKQNWGVPKSAREIHRIIAWEAVSEAEGTGIVHIAPGCGKEDFALGREEKLVSIAPLDESGNFLSGFGPLEGHSALDPNAIDALLATLQEKGLLVAVERYPHNYPHCWRCKTELLFRLVDEWFIDMRWRDEIIKTCYDVRWIPEFGLQREIDWLKNMGDWMISKKRYWGLALPIWVCNSCGGFDVIGGREELKSRAVAGWKDFEGHTPHRPWIDLVKLRCAGCGGEAHRIPDVGNPWLDAGIVPYSTLRYNQDRKYWEKWFPADFVTESFPGQFRNWFYALLAMSALMEARAPFKVLLGHATVRDEKGEEMHKSKGNAIPFEEAAEKMGADVMRWMFCRNNPANNINFGYGPADEIRNRFVLKLWNTYAFFCNYARLDGFDPKTPLVPIQQRPDIDRWILSDLQLLISTARNEFESYNVMTFCVAAETFVAEKLSNWYVRRNRRRFWKSEKTEDKLAAYQTLYGVLTTLIKLCAPIMPFLTEAMYGNLEQAKARESGDTPSIHLCDFPTADESLVDAELSATMDALLRLVSLGSSLRNSVKIKVRQPLRELIIQPANDSERLAVERFSEQICEELNIKKVTLHDPATGSLLSYEVRPNLKTLGPKFGGQLKEVQTALAGLDPSLIARKMQADEPVELAISSGSVSLTKEDLLMTPKVTDGWAGLADYGTQLLLDVRITEELANEGIAREVVRHVQELRKKSGLEMEDRIVLYFGTDSALLQQAIEKHSSYISGETLAIQWAKQPLDGGSDATTVKVLGQPLTIQLNKVAPA
ncbi:MAG TPA: isoleucine--tRNA ligase [Candidatus Binatia bacterium]